MSLLVFASALISLVVIALLLLEYYQQPLLAIATVAIGFWVLLWAGLAAYNEWKR